MATEIVERATDHTLLVATFYLGKALFGIDTALVQEVVLPGDVTVVHHAPDCVAGIRNPARAHRDGDRPAGHPRTRTDHAGAGDAHPHCRMAR